MSLEVAKQKILDRVPMETLVSQTVKLENRSGKPTGLCPFHSEKSGSFVVYPDHYHCFGCHAHGDAIDFVRRQMGLGFVEALKHLAESFQIDCPELYQTARQQEKVQKASSYYKIMEAAQSFLQRQLLHHPEGQKALQYLRQRGFSNDEIAAYEFGYNPDSAFAMRDALTGEGIQAKDLLETSLAFESRKSGALFDFFRSRVTVPIKDRHGRIIAYGGRTLGDDKPKYKNSRDTPLFDKSNCVFGFSTAVEGMKAKKRAILVEGYMDTLSLWSRGFAETVACMGTALTLSHLRQLQQATKVLYLLFDGDLGGINAGLRVASLSIQVPQLQVRVVRLPDGDDPDSFVRREGAEALEALIGQSQELLDYAIESKITGTSQFGVSHAVKTEIIPWIRSIEDPMHKSYLLGRVSQLTKIDQRTLNDALRRPAPKVQEDQSSSDTQDSGSHKEAPTLVADLVETPRLNQLEGELLSHMFYAEAHELRTDDLRQWMTQELNWHPTWHGLAMEFLASLDAGTAPAEQAFGHWNMAVVPLVMETLEKIKERQHCFNLVDNETRQSALSKVQRTFKEIQLKKSRAQLKEKIGQNAGNPDHDHREMVDLLRAIKDINNELMSLRSWPPEAAKVEA